MAYICNKAIAFTFMSDINAFDKLVKPFFVPRKLSMFIVMSKVMNTIVTVFY